MNTPTLTPTTAAPALTGTFTFNLRHLALSMTLLFILSRVMAAPTTTTTPAPAAGAPAATRPANPTTSPTTAAASASAVKPKPQAQQNLEETNKKFPKIVKDLIVEDLKTGRGPTSKTEQTLTVNYTAWIYDSSEPLGRGAVIDSTLGKAPYKFKLGNTENLHIKGWEEGLKEMKAGGKRRLIIPAEFAYGDRGAGKHVPPGATLLYEIELIEID